MTGHYPAITVFQVRYKKLCSRHTHTGTFSVSYTCCFCRRRCLTRVREPHSITEAKVTPLGGLNWKLHTAQNMNSFRGACSQGACFFAATNSPSPSPSLINNKLLSVPVPSHTKYASPNQGLLFVLGMTKGW